MTPINKNYNESLNQEIENHDFLSTFINSMFGISIEGHTITNFTKNEDGTSSFHHTAQTIALSEKLLELDPSYVKNPQASPRSVHFPEKITFTITTDGNTRTLTFPNAKEAISFTLPKIPVVMMALGSHITGIKEIAVDEKNITTISAPINNESDKWIELSWFNVAKKHLTKIVKIEALKNKIAETQGGFWTALWKTVTQEPFHH